MERRRRANQDQDGGQQSAPKLRTAAGQRHQSFLQRYVLSFIFVLGVLAVLVLVDPIKVWNKDVSPKESLTVTPPTGPEKNKPILGIADVEQLTARMAINGTVILLICPRGYTSFVPNWLHHAQQQLDLDNRFLILAEDEETFKVLQASYPQSAVLRMDVKDLTPPQSGNKLNIAALLWAYRKIAYAREIMNAGQNVLVCDVTTVWLKNPFPLLTTNDVYIPMGDVSSGGGGQLLVDYPGQTITRLQEPLPNGIGYLPPLSDEFMFLQNNVGAWVTVDYWAVVIEGLLKEEGTKARATAGADSYTSALTIDAFQAAMKNVVHLSPRPRIGLLPPALFPPPSLYFDDPSWKDMIVNDIVVVRAKLGAGDKSKMESRLQQTGLWMIV